MTDVPPAPLGAPAAPPSLPFALQAGGVPLAALRRRLATRAPKLLLGALVIGALSALVAGRPAAGLLPLAFVGGVLLLVVVVGIPVLILYGRATITVTAAEVVVRRLRRRRLPRAEVGEMVVGFFTVVPTDAGDLQVCLTRRDGRRFTTLPLAYWDRAGLAAVAGALGIEPRFQEARDERLRPFHVRHFYGTALAGALVLVVLLVAGIMVADHIGAGHRRADARDALRQWRAMVAPRLGALPGVRGATARTFLPDDAGRKDEVDLTAMVDVAYRGGEPDPGLAARVRDGVCSFRPRGQSAPQLAADVRFVGRADSRQEDGRRLHYVCDAAADPGFVLQQLARHPLSRSVRYASFDLEPLTDFDDRVLGTRLEIFAIQAGSSTAQLATTLDALCSLRAPGRAQLEVRATVTDGSTGSRRADRSCRRTSR